MRPQDLGIANGSTDLVLPLKFYLRVQAARSLSVIATAQRAVAIRYPNTLSRGEGDRKAVGEERRQNRHRSRSGRYSKLSVCRPHSSTVKNQRFLPPSPRGKALTPGEGFGWGAGHRSHFDAELSR